MRITIAMLCLMLASTLALAKDRNWQNGEVSHAIGSIPQRGFYWVRGPDTTYVIHNYANGAMVQWWLRLTVGGPVRFYSDGKNLYVIDNLNKERKCQILQSMTNPIAEQILAREAAKTPEQLAQERALELQENMFQLQRLEAIHRMLPPPPKVEITPLPRSQTLHCTTTKVGDTAYTNCQ